ncbi:wax ester/triacylglycerol synthase domain-containing protein [Rhodococcus coprophilus]|uniref:wax ester/triacylglycerol synthase domain-containing protein n=1 Tax=Rhodococcus coprophilus TaxID=38310 RepID=UPI00341E9E5F
MQLTPADAQMYWLSERMPNDQFLLFCFATDADVDAVRETVRSRVRRMGELLCHVRDVPGHLDYPYWAPRRFGEDLVVGHQLSDSSWTGLQSELGVLVATSLDARESPWRLHVFPGVRDAPGCDDAALVVVWQVSHAFADGRRATELARALFGTGEPPASVRPPPVPSIPVMLARAFAGFPGRVARTFTAGRRAADAARALDAATAAGEIPPPAPGRPLTGLDTDPGTERSVRMVVCPAALFLSGGHTITTVALTAVSVAVSRFLAARGEDVPDLLGAEVTIAVGAVGPAHNNYRNAGVELFVTEPDLRIRATRIAADLAERRARVTHPLPAQRDAATEHVPAPALRFGIVRYPATVLPVTVTGNTVVSSVDRGPADLALAGGPVMFSAGFPGLSPAMALTHGVYGLGETVTIGVAAGTRVVPDLDVYEQMLRAAVEEVGAALALGD